MSEPETSMPAPIFDRQEQLQKIEAALLAGEQVHAVYDMKGGGTGFIGITTERVIVYDKAYLSATAALVSIPYSRITTVAARDQQGLLAARGFFSTSTLLLTIHGGPSYTFEFRGNDKAMHAHNLILWHIIRAAARAG